jgi:CubicO group peptidase (beta-lactamase class C family)
MLKPEAILVVAGLCCALLACGCTTAPPDQSAAARNAIVPTAAPGAPNVTSIIPQFDAYAEKTFRGSGVPGMAVAVVQNDTVVYLRCFGVRNITTRDPITPDTRFQLASVSKSFTSTAIASMVGTDELSWDDRVATINPDFRLSDPWVTEHLTLRDLLSHRTGLPEYAGDELDESFAYNRSEILSRLRYVALVGQFRSSYAYLNAGFTAAGETAARRAGTSWEELVTERILAPTGMRNTSPRFADFVGAKDHADTYASMNGTAQSGALMNDDANSPAGGVSSTIGDMARYARLQVNDGRLDGVQVVAAEALRETHRPQNLMQSSGSALTAYALGWKYHLENGQARVDHGGEFSTGVSTSVTIYPDESLGIVVLTNSFPDGHVLTQAIAKGLDDLYFTGAVRKDWYGLIDRGVKDALQAGPLNTSGQLPPAPATAGPARPLASYTGTYAQEYYGTVRLDANATGLLAYPGHSTHPLFLVPYDGDTFRDTDGNTSVTFTVGSAGAAASARFARFDLPGRNGTFARVSP